MRTRLGLTCACAALAFLFAAPAQAAPPIRFGLQDDAWLTHGPGTLAQRLDRVEALGVDLVRFTVRWNDVASRRPLEPADPGDPAYSWGIADTVLRGLRVRQIAAVVTLVGTPGWANGGRSSSYAPLAAADFGDFARAAATRYSWIRDWTIWNEPNQARSLQPTRPSVYVARLLNPGYLGIHRVNRRARVAGGVTAPRGNLGGVSPVAWIRGMRAAGALLDVYAHHPYPANRFETPTSGGCRGSRCTTITMANLELLVAEVRRNFGAKRIWLTEYGYQTNPPDRFLGVSEALQARYIGEAALRAYRAPAVDMMIQYLYRDESEIDRFQSGLVNASGLAKIAAQAFPFPLAQTSRRGPTVSVWGQVRPRFGAQPYRLQLLRQGRATWLTGTRMTDSRGYFKATVSALAGALVRIWSPRDQRFSAHVLLR